jgi:AhpD family alkylhydroperoxidase
MEDKKNDREIADKILRSIEEAYGFVPTVNRIMSERPDIFVPAVNFSKSILENPNSAFDAKTRNLLAISAASALGSPYCLEVQMQHAKDNGASREEVMEAFLIGSYMSMSRSQSIALRKYEEKYGPTDRTE